MKLTVIGCGDAFSSGGRLQTTYLLESRDGLLLLDCGATVCLGLERAGRKPNEISTIVITHLHGDHFAGLVWLFIQGVFVTRRMAPLTIYGPPTIEARFKAATDALFAGALQASRGFELRFVEMHAGKPVRTGPFEATAFEMQHPSGAPSHGIRFKLRRKVFAFTGDTEWTEAIIACGAGADLYLMECFKFEGEPRAHTSFEQISRNLSRIDAKRILLTHLGPDMLARRNEVDDPRIGFAEDGLVVEI
jgi:ribonuclease BN (tRNA processing enzyme)